MPDAPHEAWWRFDSYEIRNGYVCPTRGAALIEYNPWVKRSQMDSGEQKPPPKTHAQPTYLSLVQLAGILPAKPMGQPCRLTGPQETALLTWCGEHGLLGVLLHCTLSVTLAARWAPDPLQVGLDPDSVAEKRADLVRPMLTQYQRANGGWIRIRSLSVVDGQSTVRTNATRIRGTVVKSTAQPKEWPGPHAIMQDFPPIVGWRTEPLTQTWARFFPMTPRREAETCLYPIPGTEEFWRQYAEPVEVFVQAAIAFREMCLWLGHPHDETAPNTDKAWLRKTALETLNALIAPISLTATQNQDNLQPAWRAPSLTGIFAIMIVRDLTARRRPLLCAACGKPFTSSAHNVRCCSKTCRYRLQKRAQRARLHAE